MVDACKNKQVNAGRQSHEGVIFKVRFTSLPAGQFEVQQGFPHVLAYVTRHKDYPLKAFSVMKNIFLSDFEKESTLLNAGKDF